MTIQRNWLRAGTIATCLSAAYLALAEPTVVLPGFVVLDADAPPKPIGQVVAVAGRDAPVVRMVDPVNAVPVFVEVRTATALVVTDERTYFSLANCLGTAYHEVPFQDQGLDAITGFMHSVARRGTAPIGNQELFASSISDPGTAGTAYNSQYANDACSPTSSGNKTLRVATSVMDIDAIHPPPYSEGS